MKKIGKVLCVIDPTAEDQPAMRRASWLAGRADAELVLFISYYSQYLAGERFFDARSLEMTRQQIMKGLSDQLDNLAEPLRKDGMQVSTKVAWDHPLHEGIVRQTIESGADIVFKDTHYHPTVARAMLTNTDWNLIRTCPIPVWLVKPGDIHDHARFVAAVDPMHEHEKPAELDGEVIDTAKSLASLTSGEVYAFHSYDPIVAVAAAATGTMVPVKLPVDELQEKLHDQHKKHFDDLVKLHELDPDKALLVEGKTERKLPAVARDVDATVVIMGAVARNRLQRIFVGSTAERVMDHLPCDLLVVKPRWFRTPVQGGRGKEAA